MMLRPAGCALLRPARRPLHACAVAQDDRLPVSVALAKEVEMAGAFMREDVGFEVESRTGMAAEIKAMRQRN